MKSEDNFLAAVITVREGSQRVKIKILRNFIKKIYLSIK